ncbi:MAG: DEAD/DEAH box helicase [Chitinivibrionales bacterium]|nr:DEAD/DEAH box helicase [Chitinivibrionales bacterium]
MGTVLSSAILFNEHLSLEWEESDLPANPDRQKLEKTLFETARKAAEPAAWLITVGLSDERIPLSESLQFWRTFAQDWIRQVRHNPEAENKREKFSFTLDENDTAALLEKMPAMIGIEYAGASLFRSIHESLIRFFHEAIRSFKGSVEEWFDAASPKPKHIDRIHFHLVENKNNTDRPFAFLATYTTRIDAQGRVRHVPLKAALKEFEDDPAKLLELLAAVKKVAKHNRLIASFDQSGELFNPIALTPSEAFEFLRDVPRFEAAGIFCRIPRWYTGVRKVTASLAVGGAAPAKMGRDALFGFNAVLLLDGEPITEAEARHILEQSEGLTLIKGKWVAVDTETLATTLDLFRKAKKMAETEKVTFADAMRMLMGFKTADKSSIADGGVTCGTWLASVFEKMMNPTLIRQTVPQSQLKAQLRPYQAHGLSWLHFLHTLGFGACLADDMGLGKTVQVLAFLQKLKAARRCSLVVAPASLLENWRREIEKFTPDLALFIIHPQADGDISPQALEKNSADCDIALTTYGMLTRQPWIGSHSWFYVICDEAQAIKNPTTKQTKAVKALKSSHRIIMTGTPVENRLSDLWSLFDFVNPGLLGSITEFKKFAATLSDNPQGYGRLRRVVHPFILRRSKSDKTIINDLPEKVEMKTYCPLSKTQVVLYSALIKRLKDDLEKTDGIRRKGVVLGYLMRCKQLCNHPDHYNGTGSFESEKSGKFQRLGQLCETIRDKREQLLLFTQFAEIIEPLADYLESVFDHPGVTLSGSSSIKHRKAAIDRFQNGGVYTPFFILSLKAGGVGLNLTNANHVIHFDRWWNPAVENQATDRAYRIGQTKNVMVHKFICTGTIEEKIDALMEDKRILAEQIIPSAAENWITEMDDEQIANLFTLTLQEYED